MSALDIELNICGTVSVTSKQFKGRQRVLQDGDIEEGFLWKIEYLVEILKQDQGVRLCRTWRL